MNMVTIERQYCLPSAKHIATAKRHGNELLDEAPPSDFYVGAPLVHGYERAERGCLVKSFCVMPHTDSWIGEWRSAGPRGQRSFFWLLHGEATFKVDGSKYVELQAGHWVIFDHRKEHLVMAKRKWLGVAWQLRPKN